MKFTMISALAATLAIVFAAPTPADQPEHLPGSKPLFPNGRLSLNVTTAGNELNGYLPNLVVGYTGEVFISKRKQSNQPVLTGFSGVSYDNLDFGLYLYLTIHTKSSRPVTFQSREGCPAPDIGDYAFDRNYDDKLYYFESQDKPLNLWKACLGNNNIETGAYELYWDSNDSIKIDPKNDPKKCIKVDLHVTDLSGRT